MSVAELAPGQIVAGKYGVQSLLARGSAMTTYHAMTAPNRQVALKLYDPAVSSLPDVMKTLERYQATTAALASKLIAPIVEVGHDPITGAYFSVTDLEANPSLAALVDLCPLSISETITLIGNLGRAVDLLHAHGIVHLALHPNNVFVGPAPAYEARILDFGSGAVRRALRSLEELEQKAPWLAPEQTGGGDPWDTRTDVFAAALVAMYAATGQSYWRSCQRGAVDVTAWSREMAGPRVPASERAQELSVPLAPAFDAVFARALATYPDDRFSSVGEFAAALARAHGGDLHATAVAGAGAPAFADIPPPPAQMEMVLSAFEGVARPSPSAKKSSRPSASAAASDVAEAADAWDENQGKRPRRFGVVHAAGIAAVLLCAGGAFALLSGSKKASPRPTSSNAIEAKPVPSSIPIEPTPPAPVAVAPIAQAPAATNEAPESAPLPEVESPPRAPPTAAAPPPAPARMPVVRRRPPAPPRAPAKKPCGKFLKRCD